MPSLSNVQEMSPEQIVQMIERISAEFSGNVDHLEGAIGMFFLGRSFGWKVLYLVHSRRTVSKYSVILGVDPQQFFPPQTKLSRKSIGFMIASKLSNFWKAVKGEYPDVDARSKLVE